jgi:hypothetical protein
VQSAGGGGCVASKISSQWGVHARRERALDISHLPHNNCSSKDLPCVSNLGSGAGVPRPGIDMLTGSCAMQPYLDTPQPCMWASAC